MKFLLIIFLRGFVEKLSIMLKNKNTKKAYEQLITLLCDREILRCVSDNEKKKLSSLLKKAKTSF